MSVSVPVAMPTQIGPCPMIYKTPRGVEPKLPPKPLPKRKPGFREKHIYDHVPQERSLFKTSYPPVNYPKKPSPTPGKLSPNLLNILNKTLLEKKLEKADEKPSDKTSFVLPDKVITASLCRPTQAVKPDDKLSDVALNKATGQGCLILDEKINQQPSSEVQIVKVTSEGGETKQVSAQEELLVCQRKENVGDESNSPQENGKCKGIDGHQRPSLLESSMSKEQDADSAKNEPASMFSSDLRSTTCSASSAFSSSSSSSSASSSSASSNTSSESSDSSIAKAFFSTPNLGSSTPKRIGSPKNFTPVENLYDSWRMDIAAKTDATTPTASVESLGKQSNKCSGYYTEISEYMSTPCTESSPSLSAENQAAVLPPPTQFCNNIRQANEQVLYMNLPTRKLSLSSSLTSKQSLKGQHKEVVIVNEYVDPQDELMDAPDSNTKASGGGSSNAPNEYEMPMDVGTTATQTDLDVVTVSCECGEFLCLPAEMEEVVFQLKHEQNMRLVSEQLVKMVEIEVKELKEDLLDRKTKLVQAMEQKQSAEGELRQATKIAAQYKVDISGLEKTLVQAKEEIAKLEERVPSADSSSDSGSKDEDTDLDLERKLAKAKDTEAKNRLEVLQTELLASRDEVNSLLVHLAQATREKAEMVSSKVHKELLRMAEDRANRADMKSLAMERELRLLIEDKFFSEGSSSASGDAPKIPPRRSEVKYPASSTGIRTSPKHFQKNNTLYSRGNMATKRGPTPVGGRSNPGITPGNKRNKAQNGTWSLSRLRKVEASKSEKEAQSEDVKEVKVTAKVSFLQRVQSRVSNAQTKSEVQKSLFDRMQLRFFTKSPKGAMPASSNCDLPDLSSLEESSCKSEYEIPMEPVQRFAGTYLIVGEESAEDSDWSSEDEGSSSKRLRTDAGGHRKARRGKSRKDRKQKDAKANNDKQKSKASSSDGKEEPTTTPAPSAPVSRLAEVLSSKEGLKSAALKSNARENNISSNDEADRKASEGLKTDRDESDSRSVTIIKIKPPPPTAPKPRAKRTSSGGQSSDNADDKARETRSKETNETDPKASGPGSNEEGIFDGMETDQPKLMSYKRTMGPQGRRLPQRYSNQVQSQRYSNQSTNSLTAVSA